MGKLEKLTKDQEDYIPVLRKKWEDTFYKNEGINKQECEKYIGWLYKQYLNKDKPMIMYMDSPLGCQILIYILKNMKSTGANLGANLWANPGANLGDNLRANLRANLGDNLGANIWANLRDNLRANLRDNLGANIWANLRANLRANLGDNLGANLWANLRDNLRANLWANLRDNLWANLGANLGANLWDNLWANLKDNLGDNLWANLRDNPGDNLWANLRDNLGDNLWANLRDNLGDNLEHSSYWCNIGDYGWVAFYDFIKYTKFFTTYNFKDFDNYKKLLQTGIYELYAFDGICIICSIPSVVYQNQNNQLHCEDGAAVTWIDGWRQYFWNGVNIPERYITNPSGITKQDVINEKNAERRRCIQEILGSKEYAKRLDIIEIDSEIDQNNNKITLYETKENDDLINEKIVFANVTDPSTGRQYFLCVPNSIRNIWEAVAWTFGKTKEEYNPVIET